MTSKFPGPYVNSCEQNDSIMHYVNGGDFSRTEIGARTSGIPKNVKADGMGISHVGDATPSPVKSKF